MKKTKSKKRNITNGLLILLVILLTAAVSTQSFYIDQLKKNVSTLEQKMANVEIVSNSNDDLIIKAVQVHENVLNVLAEDYTKRRRTF